LKHISAALSYAKEVISGHGIGAELDHRSDMMGEIISAEHHFIALGHENLRQHINGLRKKLEVNRYIPKEEDLPVFNQIFSIAEQEQYLEQMKSEGKEIEKPGCKTCGSQSSTLDKVNKE
jgi:hypothetical protein